MTAPVIDDLSSAGRHLMQAEASTIHALALVDPLSRRLSDEVASALKAVEDASEAVFRAVRALDGAGV
jgi:hypothetical protein